MEVNGTKIINEARKKYTPLPEKCLFMGHTKQKGWPKPPFSWVD
jgi:hypothetical protein